MSKSCHHGSSFAEMLTDGDGNVRVDHDLNCIKGGGGCHLREKVLAEAADTYVCSHANVELVP